MKRSPLFWPSVVLLLGLAGYGGAAIIQAIIPQAVPTPNKTGTNGTIFQLAKSTTPGAAGAAICDDGTGLTTTSGCTANAATSTTPVTVNTNTTSDQQLMELSLSAGYLNSLGRPFDFFGAGVYTTQVAQTPTLTLKIKLCTVSGCGSGTVVTLVNIVTTATVASITNNNWNLRAVAVTAATGATGNLEIHGPAIVDLGATTATADSVFSDTNTAVSGNIDLTAALFVDWTVAFSTNTATANIFTQREGAVSPGGSTTSAGTAIHSIGAIFDGGGSAMTAGKTVYFTVPYSCSIQAWNITVDTGTATIDVWKIATGTAIPTVANTITASATPAISSGTAVHSTTLTGWTTSVSANDIFGVNLKTVASATEASLVMQCQ